MVKRSGTKPSTTQSPVKKSNIYSLSKRSMQENHPLNFPSVNLYETQYDVTAIKDKKDLMSPKMGIKN